MDMEKLTLFCIVELAARKSEILELAEHLLPEIHREVDTPDPEITAVMRALHMAFADVTDSARLLFAGRE